MKEARTAVEEAIGEYNKLLGVLSEAQMQSVVTAIGLKMEELKAHLAAITEELDDSSWYIIETFPTEYCACADKVRMCKMEV